MTKPLRDLPVAREDVPASIKVYPGIVAVEIETKAHATLRALPIRAESTEADQ